MYSPRIQLGAGAALRTAIAASRQDAAVKSFRALEVRALTARHDGLLPTRLPAHIGGTPSEPT